MQWNTSVGAELCTVQFTQTNTHCTLGSARRDVNTRVAEVHNTCAQKHLWRCSAVTGCCYGSRLWTGVVAGGSWTKEQWLRGCSEHTDTFCVHVLKRQWILNCCLLRNSVIANYGMRWFVCVSVELACSDGQPGSYIMANTNKQGLSKQMKVEPVALWIYCTQSQQCGRKIYKRKKQPHTDQKITKKTELSLLLVDLCGYLMRNATFKQTNKHNFDLTHLIVKWF